MFPNPYEDEDLQVRWSASAGRFYAEGRQGAISNLLAIQYLQAEQTGSGMRFRDSRGQFVPDPARLLYGTTQMRYGNITRDWTGVGDEVYTQASGQGAYYVSMALYINEDGKLDKVAVPNRIGTMLSADDERRRIAGAIAQREGYSMGERGSDEIMEQVVRVLHWSAE